jgi:Mannosyl-glycoprotein endo-beta-N-acetylglucosaminidase/LysM domain
MLNKKSSILFLFWTSFFFRFSQAQSSDAILSYIVKYKDMAISEMQRSGVPAAITLAQGIHETEAGTSDLVRESNNHFGIKCKKNWTGGSVLHDDDARRECFRKYEDAEDSYKDHSDFLRAGSNYAFLFNLDPTDYEGWAYGLKKAGYATNPKYAQILIKLIEQYHLEDYTLIALGKMKEDDFAKNGKANSSKDIITVANNQNSFFANENSVMTVPLVKDYPSGEFKINETRVVYVKKETSFLTIAEQYEIPLARLFDFNDMKPREVTEYDQLVFIQRKRKIGDHEFHVVQAGETLSIIAQTEAIRLESLLEYNNLGANMQPAVGETLSLRSKSSSTPKLAVNSMISH